MAVMRVSEITIERDSRETDTPLYVNLPDGRQLVIWASGSFSIRVPMYEGQNTRYAEEIAVTLPTAEDMGKLCNKTDDTGNFRLTATHRH